MKEYYNYHKHSHVSNIFTIDSTTRNKQYAERAIELGHTALSTCEHGCMGEIWECRTLADTYNLKCLPVGEFYIVKDANPDLKDKRNYHIIVAPRTNEARKKCNYLSSIANIEGYYYKPRLDVQHLLTLDPDDVYITTACVAGLLRDDDSINNIFLPLYNHFRENLFLEVQNHNDPLQKEINKKALRFMDKYGLKLIAANDSHYIDDEGRQQRDVLLLGKGMKYEEESTFILDYPDYDTMADRFVAQGILKESLIEEAINNTMLLTHCEEINIDHSIKMPTIDPDLTPAERVSKLKKLVNHRFNKIRKEEHIEGEEFERYKEGIRYEMDIIEKTNDEIHTADYFLLNTKLVDLAVNKYGGVLTRGGRGSCASFYINRICGMTQLDRFKINLPIFPDRFASTARLLENRALPDIDYNVETQEPFVKAARELLGEHSCYPMYKTGNFQQKEAFKNLCRAKGIDFDTSNEISADLDKHKNDPQWKDLIAESEKYVGVIFSASVHSCAHLLCNENILYEYGVLKFGDALCVLITSAEADEYKVLKDDFLIVTVWHLIAETFKAIDQPIIPARELLTNIKNDERIWKLLADGITCTLNQVDTENGKQQEMRYGVQSFEDGALLAAAIRPSFDSWRERFLNHEDYTTGSQQLDDVLASTKGYILFQENLMEYFQWLDVTPSESIGLIKKISKKKIKPDDFAKLENRIRKAWIDKTGSEDMFDETWGMIQSCMAYGFCSAHAAATSLDMCYGAYLKVNYPLEYYTVCFNTYTNNKDTTTRLTNELDYFGINLQNIKFRYSTSEYSFDHKTNSIYKGLASIAYMSANVAKELYSLRDNQYDNFVDTLNDIKANTSADSRQLKILISLDFFSEFGEINDLLDIKDKWEKYLDRKTVKKDSMMIAELGVNNVRLHAGKESDKQFSNVDMNGILKEWAAHKPHVETTLFDRIDYEAEYLGYIITTDESVKLGYWYVTAVEGYSNNLLTLYQINNGEVDKVKIDKHYTVKEGDVIHILEYDYNRPKWRKVGDKFEKTGETERVISKIAPVTRHKKVLDIVTEI